MGDGECERSWPSVFGALDLRAGRLTRGEGGHNGPWTVN